MPCCEPAQGNRLCTDTSADKLETAVGMFAK